MAAAGLACLPSFGVSDRDTTPLPTALTLVTFSLGFRAHFLGDETGGFIKYFSRCVTAYSTQSRLPN